MKKYLLFIITALFFLYCRNSSENPYVPDTADSRSADAYRRYTDSMKKKNPLLIFPPDSEYTGDYIDKWENGLIKFRGQFRMGKRHGQWVSFYSNGEPWSELHYDRGLRHGPYIVYYPGMVKRIEGYYKNDMRDSIWSFYDSTGFKKAEVIFSKNREIKNTYFKKNNKAKTK